MIGAGNLATTFKYIGSATANLLTINPANVAVQSGIHYANIHWDSTTVLNVAYAGAADAYATSGYAMLVHNALIVYFRTSLSAALASAPATFRWHGV